MNTANLTEDQVVEFQRMRDNLEKAQNIIQQQHSALQRITATPRPLGTVFRVYPQEKVATIIYENKLIEVGCPQELFQDIWDGCTVRLATTMESIGVIGVVDEDPMGVIVIVENVTEHYCEVEFGGNLRKVRKGKFDAVQKGDRLVVDPLGLIAVGWLGKDKSNYTVEDAKGVTWADVGGLTTPIEEIKEAIIEPYQQKEMYAFYGRKPVKGILLWGPPRCGKTLLVQALSSAIAEAFGATAMTSGFIYIKGPEILSKYVSVAEARIKGLFARAKDHFKEHGYPAVIFIDEAEAILSKRGTGISSDIERTTVPAFLSEMDGLSETGAIVILATNRQDILDPAVVAEGRIDRKIHITRPDFTAAQDIFGVHLRPVPLANGSPRETLATTGAKELFAPSKVMYRITRKGKGPIDFTLGHLCSGGMIAEVVQSAITYAMRREKAGQIPEHCGRGILQEDIVKAAQRAYEQNRHLNHTDDLQKFVRPFADSVLNIEEI